VIVVMSITALIKLLVPDWITEDVYSRMAK